MNIHGGRLEQSRSPGERPLQSTIPADQAKVFYRTVYLQTIRLTRFLIQDVFRVGHPTEAKMHSGRETMLLCRPSPPPPHKVIL